MKKSILALIFSFFFTLLGNSQTEKGTFLVGGNANFQLIQHGNSYLNLNPNFGYFIKNKLCLGASLSYALYSGYYHSSIAFTPIVRYYFGTKETRSFYARASGGILYQNHNDYWAYGFGFGHTWFLNKNVAFESELAGTYFDKRFQGGLHFGFQIYLNRKAEEK